MSQLSQGLRERKKQETRQEISGVATRLFIEHGFEQVTIAEIAAAAGVAKMTVTNHFPRKEDLALDLAEDIRSDLAATVAARGPGESPYSALRRAWFAALERRDAVIGFAGPEFVGMVAGSPTLQARLRELHEQREDALASAVAADGTAVPDAVDRLVAAQLNAVHRILFAESFARTLAGETQDEIAAALADSGRRAFDLLEPAIGGYAVRR